MCAIGRIKPTEYAVVTTDQKRSVSMKRATPNTTTTANTEMGFGT